MIDLSFPRRVRFIPQMEVTECGAASLAMVLDHHGKAVPLSHTREACGVGRDGVSAARIFKAAARFGLKPGAFNVVLGADLPPLDNKGNGVAVGLCTAKQRARVLSIAPHMHGLGRHSKVELLRRDGSVQMLHDMAFDFNNQTSYLFDDLWIEQGEQIRTTCTWDPTQRPIVFGFSSEDEMCFLSTLAYPAGALSGKGDEKGFAGGNLSCAGFGG